MVTQLQKVMMPERLARWASLGGSQEEGTVGHRLGRGQVCMGRLQALQEGRL